MTAIQTTITPAASSAIEGAASDPPGVIRPLRDAVAAAVVVFAASAIGLAVTWYFATEAQLQATRSELMQVARIAATRLDMDAHRRVAASSHQDEAEVRRLLAPLVALIRSTDDITAIHTAVEREGRFHRLLDTGTVSEGLGDSRTASGSASRAESQAESQAESGSASRTVSRAAPAYDRAAADYDAADAEMRRVMDGGLAVASSALRHTSAGAFLTAYAPLSDASGRIVGVLGADLWLHRVEARAARLAAVTLAALGGVLVMSVLAGLVVFRLRRTAAVAEARDRNTAMALATARDAADRSSRAKATFVAMMGHELRTPLNAIVGYSELMHEELLARGLARLATDIGRVRAAGLRLAEIIADILDLSKMDADRLELRPLLVDLASLTADVEARVRPEAEAKGLVLSVRIGPEVGHAMVDAVRLRQILANLLRNAVKFTSQGTITVRVRGSRREPSRILWTLHDTGAGIPSDKRGLLFQPFSQVDGSVTRSAGGTGLGLVLSYRLATAMGGTLTVRSRAGYGSSFRLSIPRGSVQQREAA